MSNSFNGFKTNKFRYKSNKMCSVPQCTNRADGNISLHKFPSNIVNIKKWEMAFRIGQRLPKNARACSAHFTINDFIPSSRGDVLKRRLKKTALPSLNLPTPQIDKKTKDKKVKKFERTKRLQILKQSGQQLDQVENETSELNEDQATVGSDSGHDIAVPKIVIDPADIDAANCLLLLHG